jgi:cation:H+ antiporter
VTLGILSLVFGAVVLFGGAAGLRRGAREATIGRLGTGGARLASLAPGVLLEGLAVALVASGRGGTSLAAGAVFGTVLAVLAAGYGARLLIARGPAESPDPGTVLMPAATLVAAAFTLADGVVSRIEGLGLLVVYAAFLVLDATSPRLAETNPEGPSPAPDPVPARRWMAVTVLGALLLYLGARAIIGGADRILDHASLLEGFVGAAAVGPAVAARLLIGRSQEGGRELSTARPLRTISAFATGILGAAALVRPLGVDAGASYAFLAVAVLYTVLAVAFLSRGRAWRVTGFLILGLYGLWLALASMG